MAKSAFLKDPWCEQLWMDLVDGFRTMNTKKRNNNTNIVIVPNADVTNNGSEI